MTRGWQAQGRSTRDRRRKKQQQAPRSQRAPRTLSESTKTSPPERQESPRAATQSGGGWRSAPARSAAGLTIRAEDYGYVYSDLKRIAVLAAAIFAVLIALTFVIK